MLVDNAQVRILHVVVAPGEKTTMHEHPDNVTLLLTDGKMAFTGADGKGETVEMKAGQAMWSGAQKHMGANAGPAGLEAIVVELKGAAAPKATLPASRPNISRTTLLENPRADVFRFTADAAFKEAPGTTHDYDQVLIALAPTAISWRWAARRPPRGSAATSPSSGAASSIRRRTSAARRRTWSSSQSSKHDPRRRGG